MEAPEKRGNSLHLAATIWHNSERVGLTAATANPTPARLALESVVKRNHAASDSHQSREDKDGVDN